MKNFWQVYAAIVTAAVVIIFAPVIWLYATRTIMDHNVKTAAQVAEDNYKYCINYSSQDKVAGCAHFKELEK